jgi:hypothetical protein
MRKDQTFWEHLSAFERDGCARGVSRRTAVKGVVASIGTLAAASLAPFGRHTALAVPSDPEAGRRVTPDPIKLRIGQSGIVVTLEDFVTIPASSTVDARAPLNFLTHAGDGTGRLFTNDTRGKLWCIEPARAVRLFLDLEAVRSGALLAGPRFTKFERTMGFRSFAFHPDFSRRGQPGYGKLYTVSTETAESAPVDTPLFHGPYPVHHHDVIAEWAVDPTDPSRVDPTTRRELLRIAMWSFNHNTDQLMFNPTARPGNADYGMLYIGTGDGGNKTNDHDPYNQAQDPTSLLGKILRIDPLEQGGGATYGIPADNPFVGQPGHREEVWALGLRHPQNLGFDLRTGMFFISDIGQRQIEEVNLGIKGANYGWPLREGTFVTDRTHKSLYALPPNDAARGFTYPVAQYDHDMEGVAVVGGFVYRSSLIRRLKGHYIFGDIQNGRIFHFPLSEVQPGSQATVRELTLRHNGVITTLLALSGVNGRVDLRFGQDERGDVFVLTKWDGKIRRLRAG